MPFSDAIRIGAAGAAGDFQIERSVRFDRASNHHLKKQPSSAGNRRTFTISTWVKRGNRGANGALFYAGTSVGANHNDTDAFLFNSSDKLTFVGEENQSVKYDIATTKLFRDPSAWYHIVLAVDTTQGTASDRIKIYVNGELQTSLDQSTYPAQNYELFVNSTVSGGYTSGNVHVVGYTGGGRGLEGYLAEYHLIDGQQLTPASFAETKASTGEWIPIDTSGLTYGTNGFRLQFLDNSSTTATTLGKDTSGNSNNYTPQNFGGTAVDQPLDTPTNNFCIMNTLDDNFSSPKFTYSEGNLKYAYSYSGTGFDRVFGTHFITPGDTNKYYMEFTGSVTNEQMQWGVVALDSTSYTPANRTVGISGNDQMNMLRWASYTAAPYLRRVDGNGDNALTTSNGNAANNDIFSLVYDAGNGKLFAFLNGVEVGGQTYASGTSVWKQLDTTKTYAVCMHQGDGGVSTKGGNMTANFGQDSSFAGAKTAQGNKDSNGIGDFYYSVPAGAVALCSKNLPDPTILLPEKHFNTLVFTGNQSTNARTGLDFQPDWIVYKALNPETGHGQTLFHDSVRGSTVGQGIRVHNAETPPNEVTNSSYLVSFDSNGFTVGNDGVYNNYQTYNQTGRLYQALCWNVGDSDGATYRVVVVSDSGNKYRFRNSANTATFAQSAVTLDLAEGGTYIFDQSDSSNAGHPLRFSTTANGTHGGGSEYTTGVTTNGTPGSSGAYTQIVVAASAPTLYYYCTQHSGMGGQANTNSTLGSSNFDGATQSRVKVNTTAGISLVTYTGTGSTTTVGHGLGAKPDAMIFKNRNSEGHGWLVYHKRLGATKNLQLNSNSPEATASNKFNDTEPTSTVFTLNTAADSNQSGQTIMSYHFTEIMGYSKFGFYTANSNNDGPFAFCGFEPAFLLIKRRTSGDNNPWIGYNNVRNPINQVNNQMVWNTTEHENIDADNCNLDFLSNGFKLRNSEGSFNNSAGEYIFLAFAHSPFKNSRAR